MSQDLSNLNMGPGGHQPGITGPHGFVEVQQAGAPAEAAPITGHPTKDSIEKAAALIASMYLPPMSNPALYAPDPNLIIAITQLAMDRICLNVLDSWSKSLQQIAEQRKEDERREELNPLLREVHLASALFFSVASIFIRAIFGTQIAEALQKGEGITDEKAIARRFVAQLAEWAKEGILQGYLMTIVDQLPSAAHLTEDQKVVLAKEMQVMLLGSALASLYKVDTKWITSEDFFNLLDHPEVLKDLHASVLIALITNNLVELPEMESKRMRAMLISYMNTNPDLPALLDLGQTAGVQMSILRASRT